MSAGARARGLIVVMLAATPFGGCRDPNVDEVSDLSRRLDGTVRTIRLLSRRVRELETARSRELQESAARRAQLEVERMVLKRRMERDSENRAARIRDVLYKSAKCRPGLETGSIENDYLVEFTVSYVCHFERWIVPGGLEVQVAARGRIDRDRDGFFGRVIDVAVVSERETKP